MVQAWEVALQIPVTVHDLLAGGPGLDDALVNLADFFGEQWVQKPGSAGVKRANADNLKRSLRPGRLGICEMPPTLPMFSPPP